jgi:TonB-dependent SusC/RagA subfamily outer membrane receptor
MEYLLKASAVIILFYFCFSLFLKRETFFQHNRWFLLIGLLIALVFPLLVIPIYVPIEPIVIPEMTYVQTTPSSFVVAQPEKVFDWTNLFPIVYGIGFAVFLIQFIFQFGSLALLLLKNPKFKDEVFTYVIIENKISPFSFFKWIIYNPQSFENSELDLMLTHEKVHAKQLHSMDILLTQLACVIFWFNPLMWLYRKEVRQNLEYIADYKTQLKSNCQKEYQRLLVKTSVVNHNITLSNNFYNSLIKERIVMLKKSRSKRKKQFRYLLILPLLGGLLMSMNTETVYVETERPLITENSLASENNDDKNKHIEVVFNKDMSDKQLDEIKKELKSSGIEMSLKRLKRNSKGEISDINIGFKTETGAANYNVKDTNGINAFYFKMEEDGSFGVGAINEHEIIIVEGIRTDGLNENSQSNSKSKTYIYNKSEDKVYPVDSTQAKFLHEEHDASIERFKSKVRKTHNYTLSDSIIVSSASHSDNPFFIRDRAYFKIDSFKVKSGYFYEGNQPIKIISKVESYKIHEPTEKRHQNINNYFMQSPKPLIIIDGKVVSNDALGIINPNHIESMTILKDENAVNAYGDKGGNGVIIIKMNNTNSFTTKSGNKEKNPWAISMSTTYVDEDNPSENGAFVYISKKTSDAILKVQKEQLEKSGISVKYSKIKRNKANNIISIKIVLKNESGDETSATYKDDDGIPNIEFGIAAGKLKVRTSTINMD